MIGIKRKFEIGNTYFGEKLEDVFICIDRDEESGKFEHYRNGEFIGVCLYDIDYGCYNAGESFYYIDVSDNKMCFAENCKETMHDIVKEYQRIIEALEQSEVFEAYLDEDELIFYKIARREYSKPYYFFADELIEKKRAEYMVSQSDLVYLSDKEIKEAKYEMLRCVRGELIDYKKDLGLQ